MKLSTLLLSSAALVVAGSAYAADLPAKKGAPAAKAMAGCPAFGAGFFQIPGSDNCLKIGGYAKYVGSVDADAGTNTTARYSQTPTFYLTADARSNTEIGVVRGYGAYTNGAMDKAYVQFSGLTAGKSSSLADVAGTQGENYGASLGKGSGSGLRYDIPAGSSTFSIAVENAQGTTATTVANVTDRPDILVGVDTSVGGMNLKLVGVSHEAVNGANAAAASYQGYAVVGKAKFTTGAFGMAVFGGTSNGAVAFTGLGATTTYVDYNGTDATQGQNVGAELTMALGNGSLAIATDQANAKIGANETKRTNIGVSYAVAIAKGLTIEPEFINTTTNSTTTNVAYLRIQRDF